MAYFKIIFLAILLSGCKITKDKLRENKHTESNITKQSTIVTDIKRDGGSVKKVISKLLPPREKDTVFVVSKGTATQTIIYRKDGTIEADCQCEEIWEHIEEKLNERDLSVIDYQKREKHKEEQGFSDTMLLYIVLGLVAVTIFFLWYATYSTKKQFNALKALT